MAFIILVILAGVALLILEILIIPGMVAGIIGVGLILGGILWMYNAFGATAGNWTAAATVLFTVGAIVYSLKSRAWQRFGLKNTLPGKVVEVDKMDIREGDEGLAVSALRPAGTVYIRNQRVEAQTNGEMLPRNTKVIVQRVLSNKVIVKAVVVSE